MSDIKGDKIVCSGTAEVRFVQPIQVAWTPQPDITTFELARLLPLLLQHPYIMPYDLPTEPELLRHLKIYDPNKEKP